MDAIAAPLALANVDTDAIIPARYMETIKREDLGEELFATLCQHPSFVLNHAQHRRHLQQLRQERRPANHAPGSGHSLSARASRYARDRPARH